MVWEEQVAELPHTSVARYVRVTVKRLAQVWFEITSLTCVTVTAPPHPSLTVTDAVFTAGTWLAHVTVTLAGQVIEGGV
jgi:hypothetical protein